MSLMFSTAQATGMSWVAPLPLGGGGSKHPYYVFSSYTRINISLVKKYQECDLGSQVTSAPEEYFKGSRLRKVSSSNDPDCLLSIK